jgi:hypothetical protein
VFAVLDEPEAATSSPLPTPREKDLPSPAAFPPEDLEAFLRRLGNAGVYTDEAQYAREWLEYWTARGLAREATDALAARAERTPLARLSALVYEATRRLDGAEAAYRWLVRAHAEDLGWSEYGGSRERAEARWDEVRRRHAARWYDFARGSLLSARTFWSRAGRPSYDQGTRLVRYLILMGRGDLALEVARAMIESILELVLPLALPAPAWIAGHTPEKSDR